MLELFATLLPIALIDSLSLIPIAILPLAVLLGGKRPMAGSLAFIAGTIAIYFPFGILLLFGLDTLFDTLAQRFSHWWNSEPDLGEILLQILVGVIMIVFGRHLSTSKRQNGPVKAQPEKGISPAKAFGIGAIMTLSGLWGALPYFAAVAQILKMDYTNSGMIGSLVFYNLVFILPLLAFPALHLLLGDRSRQWFGAVNDFIVHWGNRVLVTALIGLGILLVTDGFGWLYGIPLIVSGGASS